MRVRQSEKTAVVAPLQERPGDLQALVEQQSAVVVRDHANGGQVEAYATATPSLDSSWLELQLWIDSSKADDISGCALFSELIIRNGGKHFFCITADRELAAAVRHIGFTLIELGVKPGDCEPIDWAYKTGTVSRLPRTVHRLAAHHGTMEQLLVR